MAMALTSSNGREEQRQDELNGRAWRRVSCNGMASHRAGAGRGHPSRSVSRPGDVVLLVPAHPWAAARK